LTAAGVALPTCRHLITEGLITNGKNAWPMYVAGAGLSSQGQWNCYRNSLKEANCGVQLTWRAAIILAPSLKTMGASSGLALHTFAQCQFQ